jgi:hypothetical protein
LHFGEFSDLGDRAPELDVLPEKSMLSITLGIMMLP